METISCDKSSFGSCSEMQVHAPEISYSLLKRIFGRFKRKTHHIIFKMSCTILLLWTHAVTLSFAVKTSAVKLCIKKYYHLLLKHLDFTNHQGRHCLGCTKETMNILFCVLYLLCGFTVYKWLHHNIESQSKIGEKVIRMFSEAEKYVKFGVYSCRLISTIKCYMKSFHKIFSCYCEY